MKKLISAILSSFLFLSSISSAAYASTMEFRDVQHTDWFYGDVQKLTDLDAISGFNDGTFKPQSTITRAEFVKILISSLKLKDSSGNNFTDTQKHWAKDSISTAIANGIIIKSEYGSGFEPDKPITRLEMAKMVLRALKVDTSESVTKPFIDTSDKYSAAAFDEYLIMGTVTGQKRYFYPDANATRAEASSIAVRALDYKNDSKSYKEKKKEEFQKNNTAAIGLAEDLSIKDRGSDAQIEKVNNLPDVVQVNSPDKYAQKIMTAVYLKKSSITLNINNYNENDYGFDSILKYVKTVEFEKCYKKGYSVGYTADIKTIDKKAEVKLTFTYSDLDSIDIYNLTKVYSQEDFRKALKKAILNKETLVTVAVKDYNPELYDVNKVLALANDEYVLARGYYGRYQGETDLDDSGSRVIGINLSYDDLRFNFSDINKVTSYEDFASAINACIKSRYFIFNIAINDYDSEVYNLGNILKEYNTKEAPESGYYAKVISKHVENTSPAIMKVLLTYPVTNENIDYGDNSEELILKNDKEWYNAIKNAISNCQDVLKYNIAYSSDIGDSVEKVLQMNPDIAYTNRWTVSEGEIRFTYKFTQDRILKMKEKTDEKAKQIVAQIIKPGMSEVEKAKAIHYYIIRNAKYDYTNYMKGSIPQESFMAYGVLINGTGVCQGYAAAFNLLAKLVGIQSIGVSGTTDEPHAWNMVRLDGKVMYVDVTWDDPVPDGGDKVRYDYFNLSDEQLAKDHRWDKKMFEEKFLNY